MQESNPWYKGSLGKIVFILFLVTFVSAVAGLIIIVAKNQPTSNNAKAVIPTPLHVEPTPTPVKTAYEILARRANKTVENIDVFVQKVEDAQEATTGIKKTCEKPCNLNFYDDIKAFELQQQYDLMTSNINTKPTDLKVWEQKNYVFVADHYVGNVDFSTGIFNDYPFRDWHYRELKRE